MMAPRDLDLGRRCGVYVPVGEVQAHEACGWILVDDLAGMTPARDDDGNPLVLMAPPAEQWGEGAA